MSVVACKVEKDKIYIGADSVIVYGATQDKNPKAKIFKVSDSMCIGGAGWLRDVSGLFIFSKTHTVASPTVESIIDYFDEFYDWQKKKTEVRPDGNSFIIVTGGHAFWFDDFCVQEIDSYSAVGAGRDFALTALHLGHTVEESIKIACDLSIYCEQPITVYDFKRA